MRLNEHKNTTSDYRRARDLRNNASPFEKKLWVVLREEAKKRNIKFRRQFAVHPYIADFACLEARLLVELDGASHDTRQEYDKARDSDLQQRGFSILRFTNEDVANNAEGVVMTIMERTEMLLRNGGLGIQLRSPLPNQPSVLTLCAKPREGEGIAPVLVGKEN